MRRLFIYTILLIFAGGISWTYLPRQARENFMAFIGVAARGNKEELREVLGDVILPKNPEERRGVLITELQKNIQEIKRRQAGAAAAADNRRSQMSWPDLLESSEKILEELEDVNYDKSIGAKVTDQVLESVFPRKGFGDKSPPPECRLVCDKK